MLKQGLNPGVNAVTSTDNWTKKQGQYQLVLPEGYVSFYSVGPGRNTLEWVNFAEPDKSAFMLVENMSAEDIKLNWREIVKDHKEEHKPTNNVPYSFQNIDNDEDVAVSIHEAASILGFAHISSVNYHIRNGRLDTVKVDGVRGKQVTMESIEDFASNSNTIQTQEVTDEPTMSKEDVLKAIGKAHISSVNYYLRTGKLEAVKVAGYRARRITTSSVKKLVAEMESKKR